MAVAAVAVAVAVAEEEGVVVEGSEVAAAQVVVVVEAAGVRPAREPDRVVVDRRRP
jgi:hypothetical protein